jgi:hypothetical protein
MQPESREGNPGAIEIEKLSSQQWLNWRIPAPPLMRVTVSRIPRGANMRNHRCSECGHEFKGGQKVVHVETDLRKDHFHARCFRKPGL